MAQKTFGTPQVPKITEWEKYLVDIIEQTNRNLSHLSKQVTLHGNNKKIDTKISSASVDSIRDSVPPVPPPRFKTRQACSSEITCHPSTTVDIDSGITNDVFVLQEKQDGTNFYEEARKFLVNGGTKRASISRPFEDELTKKLSQAVLRSVEKAIAEDKLAVQRRIDRLSDQVEHLSEENRKIYKQYSSFSRTIVSQDRLGKRLKDEWERQRKALKRLDDSLLKDIGWKDAAALDIKLIKDQIAKDHDSVHRVSAVEMRKALDAVTTKTMIAVDKATTISKQSLEAEISSLKHLVEVLKRENDGLRQEITSCRYVCSGLASKFDEKHVSKVVFDAFQGNLSQFKQDFASNIRDSIIEEVKRDAHHQGNTQLITTLKDLLRPEILRIERNSRRIISDTVKEFIDHKQDEVASSVLSSLVCSNGNDKGSYACQNFDIQFQARWGDLKTELMNELHDRIEKAHADSDGHIQKIIRESVRFFLQTNSLCVESTNLDELKKEPISHKTSGHQELLLVAPQPKKTASRDDKLMLMQDFENVKCTVSAIVEETKKVSESLSYSNEKIECLSNDISLIYDAIDDKCTNIKRDCLAHTVAEIHSNYESMKNLLNERFEDAVASIKDLTRRVDASERFGSASKQTWSHDDHGYHEQDVVPFTTGNMNSMNMETKDVIANLNLMEDSVRRFEDEMGAIRQDLRVVQDEVETKLKVQKEQYQKIIDLDIDKSVVWDLVEKGKLETEGKLSEVNSMLTIMREEISTLSDNLKGNDVANRKAISSFVDIASCFGKVSSLESKMQKELDRVKAEFVDLQKNVIEMNNTSMDRIDFISQKKGWIDTHSIFCESDTNKSDFLHVIEKRVEDQLKFLDDKIVSIKDEMTVNLGHAVERYCASRSSEQFLTNSRANNENDAKQAVTPERAFSQHIDDILRRLTYIESKIEDYGIVYKTKVNREKFKETSSSSSLVFSSSDNCENDSQHHFFQDESPSPSCDDSVDDNKHTLIVDNKENNVTTSSGHETRHSCYTAATTASGRCSASVTNTFPPNPDLSHSASTSSDSVGKVPTENIDNECDEDKRHAVIISNNRQKRNCSVDVFSVRPDNRNDTCVNFIASTTSKLNLASAELSSTLSMNKLVEGSSEEEYTHELSPFSSDTLPLPPTSDSFTSSNITGAGYTSDYKLDQSCMVQNVVLPHEKERVQELVRYTEDYGDFVVVDDAMMNKNLCNGDDHHQVHDMMHYSSPIIAPLNESLPDFPGSCSLSTSVSISGSIVQEEYDHVEVLPQSNVRPSNCSTLVKIETNNNMTSCHTKKTQQYNGAQRVPSLVYTESGNLCRTKQISSLCDEGFCHKATTPRRLGLMQDSATTELENLVPPRSDSDSLSIGESIKDGLDEGYDAVKGDEYASSYDKMALKGNEMIPILDDEQSDAKSIVSSKVEGNRSAGKTSQDSKLLCYSSDSHDESSNSYESSFECES
jgi:hypothetical protein